MSFKKDGQFRRFAAYGFLKNLRFFEPFIVLYFREEGFSFLEIGTLFSIREIAINLLELPTGFVADIYGRRRSMVFSMLAYITSFVLFYFFPHFFLCAMAMIFFAVGEAFRTGTHKAMILEHLRLNGMLDMRVEYYGSTRAASQLGSALSSILAAVLVVCSGTYRLIFLASVVPYAANLVNLGTYPGKLDGEIGTRRKRETIKEFLLIFKREAALTSVLNSAAFDGFFKVVKDYLQPILKSLALGLPVLLALGGQERTAVVVGIVYCIIYLGTSWVSKNAAKLTSGLKDKEAAIHLTYFAGAICVTAAGLLHHFDARIASVVVLLLLYLLQNIRRPINVAYISENISHRAMASGLSAESQCKALLMAVLAPGVGALADHFGVGGALLLTGMAMTFIGYVVRPRRSSL